MDIRYRTTKLGKLLTNERLMVVKYGPDQAKKLKRRFAALKAAKVLSDLGFPGMPPERCHELTGNRKGQLSVDLAHPYRLIFEPLENPAPALADGGLDWSKVTGVRILDVEDTHGS